MHCSARPALSIWGGLAASQRFAAAALATMAARGWFTSWAMEAVSSPIVITRDTRASSARAACSAWSFARTVSSASLRSLISRASAMYSSCSPRLKVPARISTGNSVPSRRR
jgi:hypothetical protein